MWRRTGPLLRLALLSIVVLLWLALGELWIRSYWRGDEIVLAHHSDVSDDSARRRSRQYFLYDGAGGICLATRDNEGFVPKGESGWQQLVNPTYPQPWGGASTITITTSSAFSYSPPASQPTTLPFGHLASGITLSTGPSAVSVTAGTLTFSGSTLSLTGPTLVSTRPVLTMSGKGAITSSSNTVTVQTGQAVVNFVVSKLPLPAPANPPGGPRMFFAYRAGSADDLYGRAMVVVFPFWSIFAIATLLMLLLFRNERRARVRRWRARNGCCVACGYDLRASPERCPECGSIPMVLPHAS